MLRFSAACAAATASAASLSLTDIPVGGGGEEETFWRFLARSDLAAPAPIA